MCGTCGCGEAGVRVTEVGHGHGHVIALEQDILGANDALAAANRRALAEQGVLAVNLMSSPGSGKTTLLVRTLTDVGGELAMSVVEGDQETLLDAERIGATGAKVVQVNTGAGCHLDATMLERALSTLGPPPGSVVVVENVFTYPGIGQYMIDAVTKRDVPVIEACGIVFAGVFITLNTFADVMAIVLNPRLRHPR